MDGWPAGADDAGAAVGLLLGVAVDPDEAVAAGFGVADAVWCGLGVAVADRLGDGLGEVDCAVSKAGVEDAGPLP